MTRMLIATVAGAAVLFFWSFIAWTVLPLHDASIRDPGAAAPALETALRSLPEDGAYFIPYISREDMADETTEHAWRARHETGPVGVLMVVPGGASPMAPSMFMRGALNCLASSLLAVVLLTVAAFRLRGSVQRVAFVTALGLFSSLAADLAYQVWMYFPADYTTAMVVDRLLGWLLVGLVHAAIIRIPGAE